MSTTVVYPAEPAQILKALGGLWTNLGQEEKEQGKPTVLRACAMTLIVATDDKDAEFSATQIISDLMHEHPSRGIVVAVSEKAERGIEARVLAQCWKPFGKAQQICCEQIEITSRPESWPNIGPTLVGLTAADLPVVFWCRHSAALNPAITSDQRAGLAAVMDLSTKVVVNSANEDPKTAFKVIRSWLNQGRIIADLEWTRLTLWRQPIAQIFDNASRENGLSTFNLVEIAYSGEKPSAAVYYAGGWLSAPYKANVKFVSEKGHGPGLNRITLRSETETIDFERTGSECMTLRSTNGRARQYSFSDQALTALMNEELSVVGHDPAFDAAFARAEELVLAQ